MRDKIFVKLFWEQKTKVTDEEIEYFTKNPDEIDDFSAPLNVHIIFLVLGSVVGFLFLGLSKVLKFFIADIFLSPFWNELLVDLIFEIGVALIGASVTAYLLGVLLNRQQSNAKKWRKDLRKRIKELSSFSQ